ncbi:MAG: cell division protein [Bifidobacteriaceae bacterium]|jgi:vacuolar-type H+-ATPase subunit H|nr:cell division protein [Bifidobacteriaceae bacterium]MCI1979177.1 cell division protein [Bifidobacteriaceae bacterium]
MSDYRNDSDDTGEAEISSQFIDDAHPATDNGGSKISNFSESSDQLDQTDSHTILTDVQHTGTAEKIVSDNSDSQASQNPEETQASNPYSSQASSSQTSENASSSATAGDYGATSNRAPGSRAEFTTAFDIIDEMQKTLDAAKTALFSPQFAKVDKEQFGEYLDELKKVLPVQLERASALMRESERRLEAAQDQSEAIVRAASRNADEIINKANEQADFLAGHQNVVALAEEKARTIINTAQAKADKVTEGANEYSATMLQGLDTELDKLSRDVKGGLSILRTRQQEAESKLQRIDTDSDEGND